MQTRQKHITILIFFSFVFAIMINMADMYSIIIDQARWVPVNTPPLAVGDEYHYFSVLKMMVFGGHYGIPYDSIHGILYLEFSRITPYILNLPIYYFGSVVFDTRYGILFVRIFDMLLLFFSMYYFIQTINRSNGWKNNIFLSIASIFLFFYGFQGLNTFFVQQDLMLAIQGFFRFFGYIIQENFIYNNSTINDLNRAIIASTTAPIILFIFALRLRTKEISLIQFTILLLILAFTSMPVAVAFGIISLSLDIANKVNRYMIIRTMISGIIVGVMAIAVQTKLIFGTAESAQEVINLGIGFSFGLGHFTALMFALLMVIIVRKHLSIPVIIILLILSLFQPLAMTIGGEHGSRFWLRSTNIPFLVLFIYFILTFIYSACIKKLKQHIFLQRLLLIVFAGVLGSIIIIFSWRNTAYLITHNERFVDNPQILSYILSDKEPSVVITNSTQVAMLCQIYDPVSTPLMGHFSLQSSGYRGSLTKALVNFELLGIPSETIIHSINKEAPQRHWLSKRESLRLGTQDFEDFYFDELLFVSTYASYNRKMLQDQTMSKQKILQPSFYQMNLEKINAYSLIEHKKLIYIIDNKMPLLPKTKATENIHNILYSSNYLIYSKIYD